MAKSIHVKVVGQRQSYNKLDPEAIHRAQKAINQRITDIAETFGVSSQIYKDYIAPLVNDTGAQFIRLDKKGITKLKTGKQYSDIDEMRNIVDKMLSKATKGEILERTAEQIGGARTLKQKERIKRQTGQDVEIIPDEDIKAVADVFHEMENKIYSRLNEIYDLAEQRGVDPRKGHLNRYKWYRELKQAHGKPTRELVEKGFKSLLTHENENILGLQKEGYTVDRF